MSTSITIGNVGRDLSGAIGGGDVTQNLNTLSPQQQDNYEAHRRAVAAEVEKGEGQGDIKKILTHIQAAAQISAKVLTPLLFPAVGRWVADLLSDE